jgi:hypothetical protein
MDSVHVPSAHLSQRNEKYFDILAADDSYLGSDFDLVRYQDVIRMGHHFTVESLTSSTKLQTIVALLLKGIPEGAYTVESYFTGRHGVIRDFLQSLNMTEEQFIALTLQEPHLLELGVSPHVITQVVDACERIERTYGRHAAHE